LSGQDSSAAFHTTRWSVVARAGGKGEEARRSLGELFTAYWPPLYSWLRRSGTPAADAQDLVQGLFARLIEKDELARIDADPARGRFRSFLLTALQHFAANERKKAGAHKRGGPAQVLALDPSALAGAEAEFVEPATHETPERLYLRHWAATLIDAAMRRVAAEFEARGRAAVFARIRGCLDAEPERVRYAELGRELGLGEGAVKVAVHRLRARFREVLRSEVADTLADAGELDDEIAVLMAACRRQPDSCGGR
jgi:RNA polymerase sigma factor (sigma-70 family)